jgi:hypothetical protein
MQNEFKNANTLAHAVNDAACGKYSPRPYNHFNPDDTLWWLVPSTEWPAFKYAKLFFQSNPEDLPTGTNGVYCGLSVEKGLNIKVKDFYPKEYIQTALWDWECITTSLASSFPSMPEPQYISLGLSYIPPGGSVDSLESFLKLKKQFKASHSFFLVDSQQRLTPHGKRVLNPNFGEIVEHFEKHILPSPDLPTLIHSVSSFPQSDWCWIDFYIGTVPHEGSVGQLWNERLKPWAALFPEHRAAGAGK